MAVARGVHEIPHPEYPNSEEGLLRSTILSCVKTSQNAARDYCVDIIRNGMYEEDVFKLRKLNPNFRPSSISDVRFRLDHIALADYLYVIKYKSNLPDELRFHIDKTNIEYKRFPEYHLYDNIMHVMSPKWVYFFRDLNKVPIRSRVEGFNQELFKIFLNKMLQKYDQMYQHQPVFIGGNTQFLDFETNLSDYSNVNLKTPLKGSIDIATIGVITQPPGSRYQLGRDYRLDILTSLNRRWSFTSNNLVNQLEDEMLSIHLQNGRNLRRS